MPLPRLAPNVRLVQVSIPTGKRNAVLDTLDREGIEYVLTDETSDREYVGVVSFPLPTAAVEEVLDALRDDADIGDDAITVVLDAQTVVSRRYEKLEERYAEEEASPERVARQELHARAADLVLDLRTYVALTVVSVVVATAGVLLDSAAIVVGSMVIAPLVGPAMATSVGTVIDDHELFVTGVKYQAIGAVVSIASATAFALIAKEAFLVPPGIDLSTIGQVQERVAPGVMTLAVALGSGVAGALSLSAAISTSLVGVAIAVALVPPVAVIGIGIAWGHPEMAIGAFILVLVNFLSINAAAMVTLWRGGYRPGRFFQFEAVRSATLRRVAVLVAAIAVLGVFLGAVTYSSVQQATFEERTARAIDDTLTEEPYRELERLDLEVRYDGALPVSRPRTVVVTVGRPTNGPYPGLAAAIDQRITTATGRDVSVSVRFVQVDTSE